MRLFSLLSVFCWLSAPAWAQISPPPPPALGAPPVTQGSAQTLAPSSSSGPATEHVVIILDASYSMIEPLEGNETKMVAAKRVVLDALRRIPPSTHLGLRIYGYTQNPLTACNASKLVVPLGLNNRPEIAKAILKIRPTGETPISLSIERSIAQDFIGVTGKKSILLVSDGMETCAADPCRVSMAQLRKGSDVTINTVALGLKHNPDAEKQLKCVALGTMGKFYRANTSAELADSLNKALKAQTRVEAKIMAPGAIQP
jgi:Ca-activated chloride channel family protein